MNLTRRAAGILIAGLLLIQINTGQFALAADPEIQKPPEKLAVDGVGSNQSDKYYADLKWDFPAGFFVQGSTGTFLNFYNQEILKSYKSGGNGGRVLKEKDVPADAANRTYRMKNLASGTVYYADMTAYYKYNAGSTTASSNESAPSNTDKFMTDIDIAAYSVGTNQIRIEWDDVWNTNGRINYKLYISDSSNFKNAAAKYIEPADIGPGKPVQVDQTRGKLIYTQTVKDPGRVYYIKVIPDITDPELTDYSKESRTVMVSSFILVKTTKVSSSGDGSIWKLDWSPVIVGLSDNNIKIQYEVYRGDTRKNELPGRIQTVGNTSIYVILGPGEDAYTYYIIRANVTRNDVPVYPGIKIESDKVSVKDQEVAANPPQPRIADSLGSTDSDIGPGSASILWEIPEIITGGIDYKTSYDIWLTTDPNLLNKPDELGDPISWNLADGANTFASGSVSFSFDFVREAGKILGCRCLVSGINPNTTYYFKIEAKKSYLEYVGDILQLLPYSSDPAFTTIVTLIDGSIGTPPAPHTPPFKLKEQPSGIPVITDTTATLQVKNRWYEKLNTLTNKWEYFPTEKTDPADADPAGFPTDPQYPDDIIFGVNINNFKLMRYDDKINIDVYYTKYKEGTDYSKPDIEKEYNPVIVKGFKTEANDPYEDAALNFPDYKYKRNVDLKLTGLDPNTTYVVWVRAVCGTVSSEPSDPLIITTDPSDTYPVEKPPVPVFNYNQPSDVYVDLGWNFNDKYKYYIKYGTVEDLNKAAAAPEVKFDGNNYFRVDGLKKDTTYYFWIQAGYTSPLGGSALSEWSDPYAVKTLEDIPPNTPLGFGIKTSADAVTNNSLTFEWLVEDGMEYVLEIAGDINYKNAKVYNAGKASEYKADGLNSNFRYYARLYAYNPANKLKSAPTASVIVKTLRSNDDYDSGQDNDNVISGDYVDKDANVVNGVWHIRITGINADRFIESIRNDGVLDYNLDISTPPVKGAKTSILISSRVFAALGGLKENLIITADGSRFVIRPGVFTGITADRQDVNYEITISSPGAAIRNDNRNMTFKTGTIGIDLTVHSSGGVIPAVKFKKPVLVSIPYTSEGWYRLGRTSAMTADAASGVWLPLPALSAAFDADSGKGWFTFETLNTGEFAAADKGSDYFDDIYGNKYESSISNVASAHELRSIKGRIFRPGADITTGDAVKLMLDVMDYEYDGGYMTTAVKSGIIRYEDSTNAGKLCSRETAIAMAVRVYEIKSGEKVKPAGNAGNAYNDMGKVNPALLAKVKFAVENGIVGQKQNSLLPKGNITRGEVMFSLEKVLVLAGEID